MSRLLLRLVGCGLGMVVTAASVPPNSALADSAAEGLVVAAEPTAIATSPAPPAKPPQMIAAAPRPFVTPRPIPTEPSFYGWQNIVAGHASIAAAVLLAALGDGADGTGEAGGVVGLGYVLGGPIIHAVHGDGTRSLGAIGILVGIPASLAVTGFVIDEACGDAASCTGSTWAYGLVAGLFLAPIVDGVALGWEEVAIEPEEPPDVTFVPVVNASLEPGAESFSLGVGGTF